MLSYTGDSYNTDLEYAHQWAHPHEYLKADCGTAHWKECLHDIFPISLARVAKDKRRRKEQCNAPQMSHPKVEEN